MTRGKLIVILLIKNSISAGFFVPILTIGLGLCINFQESRKIFRPFCSLFKFRCHYAPPPPPYIRVCQWECTLNQQQIWQVSHNLTGYFYFSNMKVDKKPESSVKRTVAAQQYKQEINTCIILPADMSLEASRFTIHILV